MCQLTSIIFHHLPSSSIIFHHLPSSSIIFHHLPSSSIIFHHLPSSSIIFHSLSRIFNPFNPFQCFFFGGEWSSLGPSQKETGWPPWARSHRRSQTHRSHDSPRRHPTASDGIRRHLTASDGVRRRPTAQVGWQTKPWPTSMWTMPMVNEPWCWAPAGRCSFE